mmetsp:Transcript_14803/g.43495  ORF Transcript_14803/g.43495 Transcript_14803/m.43495 type:complete len:222 (+) Transcript_14803:164-829(+)
MTRHRLATATATQSGTSRLLRARAAPPAAAPLAAVTTTTTRAQSASTRRRTCRCESVGTSCAWGVLRICASGMCCRLCCAPTAALSSAALARRRPRRLAQPWTQLWRRRRARRRGDRCARTPAANGARFCVFLGAAAPGAVGRRTCARPLRQKNDGTSGGKGGGGGGGRFVERVLGVTAAVGWVGRDEGAAEGRVGRDEAAHVCLRECCDNRGKCAFARML